MEEILILVARWLHIVSATVAVGAPIFARMALLPAVGTLDDATRDAFREAVAKRWRVVVYVTIMLFLATGFYNFLGPHAHWKKFRDTNKDLVLVYHAVFGAKLLLAFVMFFLASALAGRSAGLAYFRRHAWGWTTILVVLGLIVVGLSNYLRSVDPKPAPQPGPSASVAKAA